jgi:ABC-type multidrug transport system ATPase subunit
VSRRFGTHPVLRALDLEVSWGESVALVGVNGAGKTTLLRILAGALTPHGGTAEVGGADARSDAARRLVGLLLGDAFLYDDLTARENVRFALEMNDGSRDSGACLEVLERVGLTRAADRRVRFFSSGMRKRLALARVLALDPTLLLLDEPWASLDQEAADLIDEVVAGWRSPERAVVLATHHRDRARRTCDRILALENGRLDPVISREPVRPRVLAGIGP